MVVTAAKQPGRVRSPYGFIYFASILLTGGLTGFLAWYAWRQPALPVVRTYVGMALCECLLALTEILSLWSGTS